jgi:hypothetical protein
LGRNTRLYVNIRFKVPHLSYIYSGQLTYVRLELTKSINGFTGQNSKWNISGLIGKGYCCSFLMYGGVFGVLKTIKKPPRKFLGGKLSLLFKNTRVTPNLTFLIELWTG